MLDIPLKIIKYVHITYYLKSLYYIKTLKLFWYIPGTYLPQILNSGNKAQGVAYIHINAIINSALPRDNRPSRGRVIVECLWKKYFVILSIYN